MNSKKKLMIKASLDWQKAINEENYRKGELALIRYYKYGGKRELLKLYNEKDLNIK